MIDTVRGNWSTWGHRVALGVIFLAAFVAYNYTNFFATNWFYQTDEYGYYVLGKNLLETASLKLIEPSNRLFEIPVFTPPGTAIFDGAVVPWHAYGMFFLIAPAFLVGSWAPFYVVPLFSLVGLAFFYLLGRELFDRRVALLATGVFAFSFPMLYWSNMLYPQPPALTFFLAGTYLLARIARGRTRSPLAYLGGALCLAFATWLRYDHLLFVVLLLPPVVMAYRKAFAWKWLLASASLYVLVLLPILVLNIDNYNSPFGVGYTTGSRAESPDDQGPQDEVSGLLSDLEKAYEISLGGGLNRDWLRGWRNAQDWVIGLYPGMVLAGGLGLVYAFWKEKKARPFSLAFLLISLVWGYYILTGGFWGEGKGWYGTGYIRYLLPVWAFLALYSALALVRLFDRGNLALATVVLVVFLANLAWLTFDYAAFKPAGLLDTVGNKEFGYEINSLVEQLSPEAIIVSNNYPRYLVKNRVFDLARIGPQRRIALDYIGALLQQKQPVYLLEAPWHKSSYLGLESALAAEPEVKLEVVSSLPKIASQPEVRVVRVTKGPELHKDVAALLKHFGCRSGDSEEPLRGESRLYVVQPGDTLLGLALQWDTTVEEIIKRNSIDGPDFIRVGQELRLPPEAILEAEATDAEIACFLGQRPDILEFYRVSNWDISPANFRAIFEDWWDITRERRR